MRQLIAVVFLLVACHHSPPKTIVGPDGQRWYPVDCDDNRTDCMEEAGKLCPSGYQIAETGTSTSVGAMPVGNMVVAQKTTSYSMLVKCGRPETSPSALSTPPPAVSAPTKGPGF